MVYAREKKVDKDALRPINLKSWKFSIDSINMIFRTNLGLTSVNLIFYAPKVANLGFWKTVLTIAL